VARKNRQSALEQLRSNATEMEVAQRSAMVRLFSNGSPVLKVNLRAGFLGCGLCNGFKETISGFRLKIV
jgi:hypothetical protein